MAHLWRLSDESFAGLAIRASPGVHAEAARLLLRHVAPGRLLDVAAGSGAWLARLRGAGFTDLTAIEIDEARFQLPGLRAHPIDLNGDFAGQVEPGFAVVTALEILEHLRSPWHFLEQLHRLLAPGGYLLVSTPNVTHWASRLRFLATGELRYFRRGDYRGLGHVSPVTDLHLRLIFEEVGLELVDAATAGSFHGLAKRVLLWPVDAAMRASLGRKAVGDVAIYLVRRRAGAPPAALASGAR